MERNAPDRQAAELEVDAWFEEDERSFADVEPARRKASDEELEQLYDTGAARIVTQRNDFLIPNLLESMRLEAYINLNPPYQRRLRWDARRKSRLIESLLMNVPIPPVFLFETELAKYEVMDGQQRLSTIREFFSNEFPLTGLEKKWSPLNGKRYNDLPIRLQSGLQRRSLSAIILLTESAPEIKRHVFERLNTGGVRLNPQEIRNAVHGGPFNDLLHELSRGALFTQIWSIPARERDENRRPSRKLAFNRFYRQMLDCEIVLRFFTLAEPDKMSTSMRASLDNTMEAYSTGNPNIEGLRRRFSECLETAHDIYGEGTFRLLPQKPMPGRRQLSRGLYDAVMLGLLNVARTAGDTGWPAARTFLASQKDDILSRTEGVMAQSQSYELLVGRLNTKKSILERIALMTEIFTQVLEGMA